MKKIILCMPFFWYLEDEWGESWEWEYMRKPRRFYKNIFYKDYIITEAFIDKTKVKSKYKLVYEFSKRLWKNELIMDETYFTYSK